jgi:hypothetical protein
MVQYAQATEWLAAPPMFHDENAHPAEAVAPTVVYT